MDKVSLGITVATPKTKTSSVPAQDRQPSLADVPPPYRQNEYRFEYQALFEIQKSIGELKTAVDSLKASADSTKSKVDDLISWKNKIIGGAFVLGAVFSLLGFAVAKFSDYVTIKTPAAQVQQAPLPQPNGKNRQ